MLPNPRSFCGAATWPLIAELADGLDVAACYIVRECRRAESRAGKPYLKLVLGDRTGTLDGVAWDDADRWEPRCAPESVVGIRGRVGTFNERLQLRVSHVEPLTAESCDLERLLPSSPRGQDLMERELDEMISSVADVGLRKLLVRCLGSRTVLGRAFRLHPAAKRNHHAYLGGLLEHSLSVARACVALMIHYTDQGVRLDRDLLVCGALLHDIGKVRELGASPGAGYTTEGQLLGHILIGLQIVAAEGERIGELPAERLLLLQHLIASHQGRPEWDSPRVPQMVEALVLHYADDLDAKLNQVGGLLRGVEPGDWSPYDRGLERAFFQPPASAVTEELEPVEPNDAVELLIDLFRG